MHSNFTLAAVFIIANICMALVFIVIWARNFRETAQFLRIGLTFVLIILAVDATVIFLIGSDSIAKSLRSILFMDFLVAFRIYAFTVVGLLFARRLNDAHFEASPSRFTVGQQTSYGVFVPSRGAIVYALLAVVFMLLYSTILFQLSDAKIGLAFQGKANPSIEISPVIILAVAGMGFAEEITFRLCLQNGLTHLWRSSTYGHYWAVLGTSALWSIGHVGAVDPDWVKIIQIFVFGLILGQMNRRFGVVPCMITHALFNVAMVLLTPKIFGNGIIPT